MSKIRLNVGLFPNKLTKAQHAAVLDEVLFQPWFLPQRTAYMIRSLVPHAFWMKMRHYFDDYGCLVCESRNGYHSNGLCCKCHNRLRIRLTISIKRRSKNVKRSSELKQFRQANIAKQLLAKFVGPKRRSRLPKSVDPNRPYNPVYAALAAHYEGDTRSSHRRSVDL
jgi:hypothetical protein